MKYKLKEGTIQQLAKGHIQIEYNQENPELLKAILKAAFPKDDDDPDCGYSYFYAKPNSKIQFSYGASQLLDDSKSRIVSDFLEKEERRILGYKLKNTDHIVPYFKILGRDYDKSLAEHLRKGEVAFMTGSPTEGEIIRMGLLDVLFEPIYEEAKEEVKTETFTPTPYEGLKLQAIEIIIANKLNADKLQLFINEHIGF